MNKKEFSPGAPHLVTENNDKLIFPFGPCIFQTYLKDNEIKNLLSKGKKLKESYNFNLASNFKYGQTYKYDEDFKNSFFEKTIAPKVLEFITQYNTIYGSVRESSIYLESMWINFSKKHDFNPSHIHDGFLSFVIYCSIPENIFSVQAETRSPMAGKTIFEYGEDISSINSIQYQVMGQKNLFLIFPSKLKHFVPPYWVDEERITVSGNIVSKDYVEQ